MKKKKTPKAKVVKVKFKKGEVVDVEKVIREKIGPGFESSVGASMIGADDGELVIAGPVYASREKEFDKEHAGEHIQVKLCVDDVTETLDDEAEVMRRFEKALNTPSLINQGTQINDLWDECTPEMREKLRRDPRWMRALKANHYICIIDWTWLRADKKGGRR